MRLRSDVDKGEPFDINRRLLRVPGRLGADTEATWEDAPVCSRLAARLDASITRGYQPPVSTPARLSAVMYVNYRVGVMANLSLISSLLCAAERARKWNGKVEFGGAL